MVIKKKTALLIDDDIDFCNLVKTILEAKGMEVKDYLCINDARIYLEKEVPNIIILDMNLLNEHGTDFLKERAQKPAWQKIPIIVCSNQNISTTVKAAVQLGVNDYLLKPIRQTELLQRVRKNLIRENHLAFYFNENEMVELIVEARPIPISESSFVARSSMGFAKGAVTQVSVPRLTENPMVAYFKTEDKSRYSSSGPYDTFFTNAAVMETEKTRVQMLKSFWRF